MQADVGTPVQEAQHVERLRAAVNQALPTLVTQPEPSAMYDPVRYVLEGKGKRFRPVLLLLAAEAFGAKTAMALSAALAVEVFHNFTLVHDDIMDHAAERRGRPTVHVKWDESTAILCGDLLLALSYDLLARLDARIPPERVAAILRAYYPMVGRLCEGQTLDKVFETQPDVAVADYLQMIDRKTGALLETALEIGGRVGGASERHLAALRQTGRQVGRAFQIQDDLLDLTADDARWGKTIGGDLIEGKKTFLLLRALERAEGDEHAWFQRIVEKRGLPAAQVPEARERMERLGVLGEARAAVARHSAAALDGLDELPAAAAVETLRWLIRRMQARLH